jgi:uncharacterized protein
MADADTLAGLLPPNLVASLCLATAEASAQWIRGMGDRLVSLVLFGSVARGDATPDSDVDVLVVATGFPRSLRDRRQEILDVWYQSPACTRSPGVTWGLVTKSPEEASDHSPLYLDMVDDAVILFDREGFFARVLESMRARMRLLGSRRVFLGDGSWYWDLKPDYRYGEVIEI